MNTNTMELNMNEMETVSGGGLWDRLKRDFDWKDALGILVFGPVGELRAAGKLIVAIAGDD